MIVFSRIKNNVPSRRRHYLAMAVAWLYVLAWIAAIYLVCRWDISATAEYVLDFILLMLAPWPVTALFQSYDSFVKEQEYQTAFSGLDPPFMLEDSEDVEDYSKGEILFMASPEDVQNDRYDVLGYSRHLGYDSQGRKFTIEYAEQRLSSVEISDKLDSSEAKQKAIDWITRMLGVSQIQEVAEKKSVKADRAYLECLSLKGIYETGLKLGL